MRPATTSFLTALLALAVLALHPFVAAPAYAGEASPPKKPAAKASKTAQADDAKEAAEIGRGLLSSNEAVRRKAVDRLLARIAKGGDLGGFLDAMSRANRAWADRHERLMELWLHDAVHGNAVERERAVRLLTALGEKAIRRLALELRHARYHRGGASKEEGDTPQAEKSSPADAFEEVAAGVPQVYETQDLVAFGMNPFEISTLLRKVADAVEVKRFKTLYVVTAMDAGHERLRDRLHQLRVRYRAEQQQAGKEQAGRVVADGAKQARSKRDDAQPVQPAPQPVPGDEVGNDEPDEAPPQAAADAEPAPGPPQTGAKVKAVAGTWQLEPALFHLPRASVTALVSTRRNKRRALPIGLLAGRREVVRTEDFGRARAWVEALRRVPDARTGLPLRGPTRLASGTTATLFAGKHIHYSKSLRRTKGGAWTIVTDAIPHGIELDVTLAAGTTALRVDLVATHTEVGLPIPVVRVQPSAKATPVELESPEWSTTRARRSFDLPLQGGGVLVSLRGLGSGPDEHIVLALTLRRPAAAK